MFQTLPPQQIAQMPGNTFGSYFSPTTGLGQPQSRATQQVSSGNANAPDMGSMGLTVPQAQQNQINVEQAALNAAAAGATTGNPYAAVIAAAATVGSQILANRNRPPQQPQIVQGGALGGGGQMGPQTTSFAPVQRQSNPAFGNFLGG